MRQGSHKQLDRGEVSGTGKKPHPQKGTGRARAGTLRSPIHRGGGRAFPKVRLRKLLKMPLLSCKRMI